jgi:hypothetical protein
MGDTGTGPATAGMDIGTGLGMAVDTVDTMLDDGVGAQQPPELRLEQQPLAHTDRLAISCRTFGMVMPMSSNM